MFNLYNRVIKYSLYLLVFLLPLFFLPFSMEAYEFNKQYLLFFLVSIAFIVWLAKMVICDKEIRLKRTPLDIPVLIFMLVMILSVVFSIDRVSSILGFYGRFSPNLLGMFSLGGLYFLITNNITLKSQIPNPKSQNPKLADGSLLTVNKIIKAFLWSSFFVVLMSYFSIFNVWQKIGSMGMKLPFDMFRNTFNPAAGSLEGLAIFLSVVVILLVGLLLQVPKAKKIGLIAQGGLLLTSLGLLLLIDFKAAWMVLALGSAVSLVLAFWSRAFKERINVLLLPIFLIIFSIVFIFINLNTLVPGGIAGLPLPQEILLNQATSWKVAGQAIKEYPIFGSGPGTFSHSFSLFRPAELNQTGFWQLRIDKAGNHIAEMTATTGLLGLITYLMLIGGFLLVLKRFFLAELVKSQIPPPSAGQANSILPSSILNQFPLFTALIALFIAQFFYYQNSVLALMFWLFLGCAIISLSEKSRINTDKSKGLSKIRAWIARIFQPSFGTKNISFKDFPELSLLFNVLLIILIVSTMGAYYFLARFYWADVSYREGIGRVQIEKVEKARNLNPYRVTYRDSLVQFYLSEVLMETSKPVASQNVAKIQQKTSQAIQEAKIATAISPRWVKTQEVLAMTYRDIRGVVQGAGQWAIISFQQAIALEPSNPVLHTELGKILILEGKIKEGMEEFEKALELKSNYLDAKIQLALIYEGEDVQKTIGMLEEAVKANLYNVKAHFELGRVYFNEDRVDEAIAQFQNVLVLRPSHSNTLYSLGVAYQRKEMRQEAISMFKKALELNPGNEDVLARLKELQKEPVSVIEEQEEIEGAEEIEESE